MASACTAFLTGDSNHSPLALYHMSQAYRLINQQLSGHEALSDATIAVVATINIYDRLYGDPQKAMVHLNGVTRMVALRGGIGELAKRNFVIAEKVFRLEEAELFESALHQSVCVGLREVVLDFLRLSHILNEASLRHNKLDPAAYQSTLMYLGYRLLETKCPRHNSEANTNFHILVRLAMAGFYNTFCFGLDRKLITFPPLMDIIDPGVITVKQFTSVAQVICENDRSRQMVVFWALLMGQISSLTAGDDDSWLVANLKTLANDLELRTWPEVSNAFHSFPWVKVTHEAHGEKLWNKVLT
ncbi:hypothetical protein CIB48_g5375 [Xylaria polymorpha]|nr:hypothetical protein CIB48_g5375 [Xylaria polymorpha]